MDILTLLQVGFAWTKLVAKPAVSSCLAFSSLLRTTQGYSGYFLLHFPSSRLDLPLASTLLCEARTFLKSSLTLDLRPSDQADVIILTSKKFLSIPFFKKKLKSLKLDKVCNWLFRWIDSKYCTTFFMMSDVEADVDVWYDILAS